MAENISIQFRGTSGSRGSELEGQFGRRPFVSVPIRDARETIRKFQEQGFRVEFSTTRTPKEAREFAGKRAAQRGLLAPEVAEVLREQIGGLVETVQSRKEQVSRQLALERKAAVPFKVRRGDENGVTVVSEARPVPAAIIPTGVTAPVVSVGIPSQVVSEQRIQDVLQGQQLQQGTLLGELPGSFQVPEFQTITEAPPSTFEAIKEIERIPARVKALAGLIPGATEIIDLSESETENLKRLLSFARSSGREDTLAQGLLALLIGAGASVVASREFVRNLITQPIDTIKSVPSAIKNINLGEIGRRIRARPGEAIGFGITEIVTGRGFGGVGEGIAQVSRKIFTRLDPKFIPVTTTDSFKVTDLRVNGDTIKIIDFVDPSEVIKVTTATGRVIDIPIAKETVKELGISLKEQAKLAGTTVDAVSGQRGLFRLLNPDEITLKKPLPKEDRLIKSTSNLLKRFDEGKLNPSEIIELDLKIKKETGGKKGLIERTFFADPQGRLRESRLGVRDKNIREAKLVDMLSGDVSFTKESPQAIIFESVPIAEFPKRLKNIEKKLKTGQALNEIEQQQLLKFQLEKTGEFKPIGFLAPEPEIVLSPGEIIRKKKTIAVTLIKGKRVPIIQSEIVKATQETTNLIEKAKVGTLTADDLSSLKRNLKVETGFDVSNTLKTKPFISPTTLAITGGSPIAKVLNVVTGDISSVSSTTRAIRPSSSIPVISSSSSGLLEVTKPTSAIISKSGTSSRIPTLIQSSPPVTQPSLDPSLISPPPSQVPSGLVSTTPSPLPSPRPRVPSPVPSLISQPSALPSGVPSLPPSAPPSVPSPVPKVLVPVPIIPKKQQAILLKQLKKKFKKNQAFQLLVKRRGKFEKIGKPDLLGKTIRKGAGITEDTISATFKVVPTKKTIKGKDTIFLPPKETFRDFKRVKGKKVKLELTWIERRSKRLSSKKEVLTLQSARKNPLGLKRRKL